MSVLLADIGGTNIRVMLLKETEISSLNYYKTNKTFENNASMHSSFFYKFLQPTLILPVC